MKTSQLCGAMTWVGLIVLSPSLLWGQSGTRRPPARPSTQVRSSQPTAIRADGIAVVELFTSQGCSSCPSADAALRQIATVAEKSNLPVYVLSFHVDYWNRLGWDDPYSDENYTRRQHAYASAMGSKRVYTPQMIVSGTAEFLGSDKNKAHQAITQSLSRKANSSVKLNLESQSNNSVQLQYTIKGTHQNRYLNVAVVESPESNKVLRGENEGRTLQHVNVVRSFKAIRLEDATGTAKLEIPPDLDLQRAAIVAYVQDPSSLAVTGASSIEFGS